MPKPILILCPYPNGKAPSQRFRFEQYTQGQEHIVQKPFWRDSEWPAIYRRGGVVKKAFATARAMLRRLVVVFSIPKYSRVFVHREATPVGPPWVEWMAAKIFRKPLFYDFDDAVWLPNSSDANAKWVGKFKNHGKTKSIIRLSQTVLAGNDFLAGYARTHASPHANIRIVPTTVDTERTHRPKRDRNTLSQTLTIGWTGTHSTIKQIEALFPVLEALHRTHPFRFLLISDRPPTKSPGFVEFRPWKKETEIADLEEIDIGVMPLYHTDWERGKCGFKAIQYMALEIPAVVSNVGVNPEIAGHGQFTILCPEVGGAAPPASPQSPADFQNRVVTWETALIGLLTHPSWRREFGKRGRQQIVEKNSVQAMGEVYREVFGIE